MRTYLAPLALALCTALFALGCGDDDASPAAAGAAGSAGTSAAGYAGGATEGSAAEGSGGSAGGTAGGAGIGGGAGSGGSPAAGAGGNAGSPTVGAGGGVAFKHCGPPIVKTEIFSPEGWGGHWSHVRDLIALNKKDADGYYHIYTIRPDGTGEARFAANNADFPAKTTGSPDWDPSGKWMAFVAEKADHPGSSSDATPGWGGYTDLWVATADGAHAWRLVETGNTNNDGLLIPIFSPDGKTLEWAERTTAANPLVPAQVAGYWTLKLGDFVVDADGTPHLDNVRAIGPTDGKTFNEPGGFSADGKTVLFTTDVTTNNFWSNDICAVGVGGGSLTRLTDAGYNEHPRYTPDGRVLWMSGVDSSPSTEWWLMNADGSNKQRLSYFTDESKGAIWTTGPVPAENWSLDGSYFFGDVQTNLVTAAAEIRRVTLTCD